MENGKDNIIARIAEDTDRKVSEILTDAEKQAAEILDDAQKEADAIFLRAQNKVAQNKAELLRRADVNVQLNCRKYRLQKRQQLVSAVFDEVRRRILALTKKDYLVFCEKQLALFAERGEQLVVCLRDADILTEAVAQKYGLTLSKNFGNFDGGFVLLGDGYEKDVTLDAVIADARLQYEHAVVQMLFAI